MTYRVLFRNLWQYARGLRGKFVIAMLLKTYVEIGFTLIPVMMATIITLLAHQPIPVDQVWWIFSIAVMLRFTFPVCNNLSLYLTNTSCNSLFFRLEEQAFIHALHLDFDWHENHTTGSKLARIRRGAESYYQIIQKLITEALPIPIILVSVMGFLGFASLWYLVIFGIYILVGVIFTMRHVRIVRTLSRQENEAHDVYDGVRTEAMNNFRTVKSTGMDPGVMERFLQFQKPFYDVSNLRILKNRKGWTMFALFTTFIQFTTLYFTVHGIIGQTIALGILTLVIMYFNQIREIVERIGNLTFELETFRTRIERFEEFLQTPQSSTMQGHARYPKSWKTFHINNVSFQYDNKAHILSNLDVTIRRGEKLGIVGLSGAGKSTLSKLLLKLYPEHSGAIMLDDTSLWDIKRQEYMEHVACVLQETEVFDTTLRENITIAGKKQSKRYMDQVIHASGVEQFLHKLPEGLDTRIGENGIKLSGGEKQRLGIARALYKQPDILILDEATSHLDIKTEEHVQEAILALLPQTTMFVIAHRLATLREMDHIVVLKHGEVIELGNFAALVRKKGEFAKLWARQSKR